MVLGESAFINRTPILDTNYRIRAYDVEFFSARDGGGRPTVERVRQGSALAELLGKIEPEALIGDQKAIIQVEPLDLSFPVNEKWQKRIVSQIPQAALTQEGMSFQDMTGNGNRRLCIGDVTLSRNGLSALPASSFAKIDTRPLSDSDLSIASDTAARSSITLIATGVDTIDQLERCNRVGIGLCTGDFFTKPTISRQKSISPNHALLLELASQTSQNGDIRDIETIFKKNPDLAFGLMNLVHSAYYRVGDHVASIRQAIALLGYENLHKWVALMLFTVGGVDPTLSPLFEKAVIRARTMELAVTKLRRKGLGSSAYITGIFSLIPALFDVPLKEVLEKANFVEEIKDGLLGRSGVLGGLLAAVEALEKGVHETLPSNGEEAFDLVDLLKVHTMAITEHAPQTDRARFEPNRSGKSLARAHGQAAAKAGTRMENRPGAGMENTQRKPSWIARLLAFFGVRNNLPA